MGTLRAGRVGQVRMIDAEQLQSNVGGSLTATARPARSLLPAARGLNWLPRRDLWLRQVILVGIAGFGAGGIRWRRGRAPVGPLVERALEAWEERNGSA